MGKIGKMGRMGKIGKMEEFTQNASCSLFPVPRSLTNDDKLQK